MEMELTLSELKALIKEGVEKLHRKALIENRINQINKELDGLLSERKYSEKASNFIGEDIGNKGKGFKDVVAKAKAYGAKDPEAIAAAAMWKNVKRK